MVLSECDARKMPMVAPSSTHTMVGVRGAAPGSIANVKAARKKVLLLEDDPAFKEIMTAFLIEHDYDVKAVQNGVDGVHEVLASDFEVILCDMLMPTLPGDMFYRAVERMRPHLCERFVFMTGYRSNQKVNEFIDTVNGTILTKPFHVDDLLELFAFVQLRTTLLAA
jgi:CheY-like chemotaxis protein